MKYIFSIFLLFLAYSYQVIAQDDILLINLKNGPTDTIPVSQIQKIQFENITTVKDKPTGTSHLSVEGNYPNPFSEGTTIEFAIESGGTVEVIIYDNSGTLIQTLTCENCTAGKNQVNWDTRNQKGEPVPSGVYYYEIRTNKKTITKQMLKVR